MNNIVDSENNELEEEIKIEKETLKRLKIYIILNGWSTNYIQTNSKSYFYLKSLDEKSLDKKFIKNIEKIKQCQQKLKTLVLQIHLTIIS